MKEKEKKRIRTLRDLAREINALNLGYTAKVSSIDVRSVGDPLPTGTPCPSLPQTPGQMSKSAAIASTLDITSIARPIRLAPRTGVVTSPCSIR